MRHLFYILFLGSAFFCSIIGQSSKADSLKNVWQDNAAIDSLRYHAGLELFMLKFRKDLDSARAFGYEILEFSRDRKNPAWESTVIRRIGNTYAIQGNFREALKAFEESYELNRSLNDKKGMATTLSNLGTVHYELGNYPEALKNLLTGLKLSEELDDKVGLSRVTNNIGNVYVGQQDYAKALEYYTYSLELKKEVGNPNTLANAYNNIGLSHIELKNHDLALENLLKSAELAEGAGNMRAMTRAYSNLGKAYSWEGEHEEALNYLNQSVQIKNEIGDREGLITAHYYRGMAYLGLNNYRQAIRDCNVGLSLAEEMGAKLMELGNCECLSEAWEGLGNTSRSLQYFKRAFAAKDSLFNDEKAKEITQREMRYQFEKQQLADSIAYTKQKAEQELLFEKDLNRQRNLFNLVVFGGIGLLLILGIYWGSRQKSKKLERERTMVNRLKQIDQLKDQFLANTSHELRTPLNGIIGLTESLKDGVAGKMSQKAIENLDMISSSGKRLTHLVNDILDFSKLKNKDLKLVLRPVDIHATADIVLKLSKPLVGTKKLRLINSVPTDVAIVEADENRVQQILYNLVGNAIKFSEKGEIVVSAEVSGKQLAISVSDTGIGIPQEKFETIFKSFEQADGSTERRYGGTGLGLSISRQLVELHHGSISVNSVEGQGSSFVFTLPLSKIKRSELKEKDINPSEKVQQIEQESSEDGESVVVQGGQNETTILIVDDEPVNRRVLQNHLTVSGYGVKEVSNGEEALKLLEEGEKIDLVLLDVMMPGLSGYEVCEKIRERYLTSELPVVLLTAKNRVSDLVTGFNAGANDYLTKPFSKNELLSRIKTHLNLQGIHKAASRFVPTEFIKSVGRDEITEVELGDHVEKEVTVLFSDIREYTHLAESMTPRQNFKFVNSYVGKMGPIVQQNKGFVNQYLGDGIMALFPDSSEDALKAAIGMQKEIEAYNERRVKEGNIPISVGIGLHTGPLVMGIIGDVNRNDTAIIADTVNTASRMEGVTKYYGARIIISESSFESLQNPKSYGLRPLGKVKVKGKDKIVGIYECFDGDPQGHITIKQKTLSDFNKGLNHFLNNEFPKASAVFDKVLSKNPEDGVARYFMTKSAEYTIAGVPGDWEAINTMDQK
ncbi:tetratricopeptide repeat protein [Poritiphilus flavus]|uniref:histidine kinase n=1 Tax=Poritiphilus flavus TaxID=2697053 RepID=A0A6L9E9V4_9FLAO|nr:tetratricopeptide repeat protein [Poritiphilus flavus]NAS11577.1 tetratricopeptide repeat protein [Poritiphilus flavus]